MPLKAEQKTITTIQFKRGKKNALEVQLVGSAKPLRGEPIWEIDTNKWKIGDGSHNYVDLPYVGEGSTEKSDLVIEGYYEPQHTEDQYGNNFWKQQSFTDPWIGDVTKLYLDLPTKEIYYYKKDVRFVKLVSIAQVDSNVPGLIKLYSTHGSNTDGTMTQKSITNAIGSIEFKVSVDPHDHENILSLDKPW